MFKRTAVSLGRCTQDCLRRRCIRSHHLAKIQEQFTPDVKTKQGHFKVLANLKNKGIDQDQSFQRYGRPMPKTLEDGSVGVIHVQNESANLANPMVRRFLHDLEFQQAQRIEELEEETKNDQDNVGSQTKQITMTAGKGDSDKMCKELAAKKKSERARLKKKCSELAARDKCEKAKLKKQCKELAKKEKAAKGKKKGSGKKKDASEDEDESEKDEEEDSSKEDEEEGEGEDMEKECKKMAQKEKCRKLAKEEQKKKQMKKCKEMVQKEKCKKMAKKKKGKKSGDKGKSKKSDDEDECD